MADPGDTQRDSGPRIPFRVFVTCYVILGALLVYALVFRWLRPVYLDDPVQVESSRVAEVEQRVDPNTATWPELARLPNVGETIAKRIIAYREQQQRADGGGEALPVFRSAEDLDAVPAIGPKTIERLRPYLKFPTSAPSE
jgi:DNA uptake protein ComE-like DNA-binding protein